MFLSITEAELILPDAYKKEIAIHLSLTKQKTKSKSTIPSSHDFNSVISVCFTVSTFPKTN